MGSYKRWATVRARTHPKEVIGEREVTMRTQTLGNSQKSRGEYWTCHKMKVGDLSKFLFQSQRRLIVGFPGGSDGKDSPAMQDPWVGKIPWRRKWQPTPVILPGEFHGQRSLADCSPWGCKESGMTEQLSLTLEGGKDLSWQPCYIHLYQGQKVF